MKIVRVLILSGHGINCEEESKLAFELAGAIPKIIHLNKLFNNEIELTDYDLIMFPGGFSFGDDLGAGMVLSARLKKDIYKLNNFVENGGFILGVCNGFQVLVNLGLLPNIKNNNNEVALIENEDGKFINDWVNLKVNEKSNSPFFKGISEIFLPIRNQEGRLIVGDNSIKNKIIENNLNVLTYIKNPNGSELDIAGLTDNSKHILGLMPHPEAFLSIYNHPNWAKLKKDNPNIPEIGEGLTIFKNIVEYIIENN